MTTARRGLNCRCPHSEHEEVRHQDTRRSGVPFFLRRLRTWQAYRSLPSSGRQPAPVEAHAVQDMPRARHPARQRLPTHDAVRANPAEAGVLGSGARYGGLPEDGEDRGRTARWLRRVWPARRTVVATPGGAEDLLDVILSEHGNCFLTKVRKYGTIRVRCEPKFYM